eukprot:4248193-Pleurochrysis_carterae.AAC.1
MQDVYIVTSHTRIVKLAAVFHAAYAEYVVPGRSYTSGSAGGGFISPSLIFVRTLLGAACPVCNACTSAGSLTLCVGCPLLYFLSFKYYKNLAVR